MDLCSGTPRYDRVYLTRISIVMRFFASLLNSDLCLLMKCIEHTLNSYNVCRSIVTYTNKAYQQFKIELVFKIILEHTILLCNCRFHSFVKN